MFGETMAENIPRLMKTLHPETRVGKKRGKLCLFAFYYKEWIRKLVELISGLISFHTRWSMYKILL